jgi:tRNA(adenine34) deaminase
VKIGVKTESCSCRPSRLDWMARLPIGGARSLFAALASLPAPLISPRTRAITSLMGPPMPDDEQFMRAALTEANLAFAQGEVPIGAVLVRDGAIVSRAHNQVEQLCDASAHAEMLCLRAAAASAPTWRLNASTLYCTIEPCPMCLAALHAFRVERLVYGASNPRLGAVEGAMRPSHGTPHPYHDQLHFTGGVLELETGELMRAFFRKRRLEPAYERRGQQSLEESDES